jgi:hypothetical protein
MLSNFYDGLLTTRAIPLLVVCKCLLNLYSFTFRKYLQAVSSILNPKTRDFRNLILHPRKIYLEELHVSRRSITQYSSCIQLNSHLRSLHSSHVHVSSKVLTSACLHCHYICTKFQEVAQIYYEKRNKHKTTPYISYRVWIIGCNTRCTWVVHM